ncbi:hypothetical protein HMPREF0183_0192 [Brevibacterium mcbrellneri ATCC 49030]|uniref:Uncharacterized protein n=1 Tax=Brevibacterium mcbrellneri ATCC 49030 TaxID=585530 RepID=D4YJT2_9MICO|nr:hypothetical protein HMPREF0183_0192 [Brevibacterium mcbrellneri ATCC 49030]
MFTAQPNTPTTAKNATVSAMKRMSNTIQLSEAFQNSRRFTSARSHSVE